jgi:hypothetical protein
LLLSLSIPYSQHSLPCFLPGKLPFLELFSRLHRIGKKRLALSAVSVRETRNINTITSIFSVKILIIHPSIQAPKVMAGRLFIYFSHKAAIYKLRYKKHQQQ